MATLNIHNETNINAKGTHTKGSNKPVICIDTGEIFASLMDAAEHYETTFCNISNVVRGKQKTAVGKRFCYLSRVTENIESLTSQINKLSSDAEDARRWREYQAEQAAIRKAREDIEMQRRKLEEKLGRRNVRVEALQEQLRLAIERRDETERELAELNETEVNVA